MSYSLPLLITQCRLTGPSRHGVTGRWWRERRLSESLRFRSKSLAVSVNRTGPLPSLTIFSSAWPTLCADTVERVPAPIPIFVTTDNVLRRQQRALLASESLIQEWGLLAGSLVRVTVGRRVRGVWLYRDDAPQPTPEDGAPLLRLDVRTAESFGVPPGHAVEAELELNIHTLVPQPMRLDFPQGADLVVVSTAVLDSLGGRGSLAVVRSASRVMTARAWAPPTPVPQAEHKIRLNYHTRLLLGVPEAVDTTVQVSAWPVDVGNRPAAILRDSAHRARTLLGAPARAWLGAPELLLAVRSAASIDDGQRVARCAPSTIDLLGVEAGDRVRVRWGTRSTSVRVFARAVADVSSTEGPLVVDWSNGRTDDAIPEDSEIFIPAAVRAELGAPRDSILSVRRSTAWLLRKRAVALTLPLVGVAISVPGLDLPAWAGVLLLVVASLMTLARDRVPRSRRRVRLDG